jgi:hypothetical protein
MILTLATATLVLAYPPAGTDNLQINGRGQLMILNPPGAYSFDASGSIEIYRGNPYDPGDGLMQIDMQISSMNMTGMTGPGQINLSQETTPPSGGQVKQTSSGMDFPAQSFFDIYYTVNLPGMGFLGVTRTPIHYESTVNCIPFCGGTVFMAHPVIEVDLYDPTVINGPVIGQFTLYYWTIEEPEPVIEVEFVQLDLVGANQMPIMHSTIGRVEVTVTPPPDSVIYINIVADSMGTGTSKWIVRNLPIIPYYLDPTPHCFRTMFDFGWLGAITGVPMTSVVAEVSTSTLPLPTMPIMSTITTHPVGAGFYAAEGRPGGPHDFSGGMPDITSLNFPPTLPLRVEWRSNMPNVEAGTNECAPASAANSLAWLTEEHGYFGVPPVEELLDSLKNARHMNTSSTSGTGDRNMIEGKLKLIDEFGLPLEVHFQDNALGGGDIVTPSGTAEGQGTRPTWDWIEEQVDAGQDVEIGITWLDDAGQPDGGHWVTLEGKIDLGEGARGVWYRHDIEQNNDSSGTDSSHFSWITMRADSFLVLTNEPSNYIDIVVAESPTIIGPYDYIPGDINGDGNRIGGDVTYGVRYFKAIGPPPPDSFYMDSTGTYLYVAGDVNGNCEFRGSDITRLVSYFKGNASLACCHFFPTTLPPILKRTQPAGNIGK